MVISFTFTNKLRCLSHLFNNSVSDVLNSNTSLAKMVEASVGIGSEVPEESVECRLGELSILGSLEEVVSISLGSANGTSGEMLEDLGDARFDL